VIKTRRASPGGFAFWRYRGRIAAMREHARTHSRGPSRRSAKRDAAVMLRSFDISRAASHAMWCPVAI
jgi:hypothetical protein